MNLTNRYSLNKIIFVLLFFLIIPTYSFGQGDPLQFIIAIDESESMDRNDSEKKRYNALEIFSKLSKVLYDLRIVNIQLGVFPFAENVFGPENGKIALGSLTDINPALIASQIRGGSRDWTRIDRVLQDASQAFWINSRKIIILLSDGVDSVYIEPEYRSKVFGKIKNEFRTNRNLVPGTDMYSIIDRCKQEKIKIHSLIINSAFRESYAGEKRKERDASARKNCANWSRRSARLKKNWRK